MGKKKREKNNSCLDDQYTYMHCSMVMETTQQESLEDMG